MSAFIVCAWFQGAEIQDYFARRWTDETEFSKLTNVIRVNFLRNFYDQYHDLYSWIDPRPYGFDIGEVHEEELQALKDLHEDDKAFKALADYLSGASLQDLDDLINGGAKNLVEKMPAKILAIFIFEEIRSTGDPFDYEKISYLGDEKISEISRHVEDLKKQFGNGYNG